MGRGENGREGEESYFIIFKLGLKVSHEYGSDRIIKLCFFSSFFFAKKIRVVVLCNFGGLMTVRS